MPITVTNVRDDLADPSHRTIKLLVAGQFGAGKTRTASTWPDVVYADAEGRMLSVQDRNPRKVTIASMADLDELKAMLDQAPDVRAQLFRGPVRTVVIDTVDEVARIVIRERLRAERQESMRIQDWGYLGDTLRNFVRGYRNLRDLNVIFNVHVRSSEDSETGRVEYQPAIQGAMGGELAGYVDEAFLIVARPSVDPATGERVVARYFQTYPDSQYPWLKDHSGALPMELPVNFEDDYARLSAFVFGALDAPTPAPPAPAPAAPPAPATTPAPVPPAPERTRAKKKAAARAKPEPAPPRSEESAESVLGPNALAIMAQQAGQRSVPADVVRADNGLEPAPAPEPVSEPVQPSEIVPEAGTPDEPAGDPLDELGQATPCSECGRPIENQDYLDLSRARYGEPLCREHFAARKTRR